MTPGKNSKGTNAPENSCKIWNIRSLNPKIALIKKLANPIAICIENTSNMRSITDTRKHTKSGSLSTGLFKIQSKNENNAVTTNKYRVYPNP